MSTSGSFSAGNGSALAAWGVSKLLRSKSAASGLVGEGAAGAETRVAGGSGAKAEGGAEAAVAADIGLIIGGSTGSGVDIGTSATRGSLPVVGAGGAVVDIGVTGDGFSTGLGTVAAVLAVVVGGSEVVVVVFGAAGTEGAAVVFAASVVAAVDAGAIVVVVVVFAPGIVVMEVAAGVLGKEEVVEGVGTGFWLDSAGFGTSPGEVLGTPV